MLRPRLLFPVFMLAAIVVAGCGGGGASSAPPVNPVPTLTPHAGPTTVPVGPSTQVVSLTGNGYSLTFTVPPVIVGGTSSMSASLQTSVPSGAAAPQLRKRAPNTVGGSVQALVYLTVSTSASVEFSAAPSFSFTLPSGTSIGAGQSAYLLFYDPYVAGSTGWVALLGPGTVNGQNVTFPSVQTGVTLNANTQYVFALAVTTAAVPTATPAPTPTATPSKLPAYCSSYSTPVPNANSSPQPVWFTDNSGTGAQVYLYVVTGAPPSGGTQTQYLAANGQLTNFTQGATAPPIPLACFPGSTHQGSGLTFELPPPTNANQSANLYIAYATPEPGGAVASPLTFIGLSNGGYAGPNVDWYPNLPNGNSAYVATPWDFVEYTLPNGITDVTQVDKVGLPMQLTQGASTIGFASGQYDLLKNDIVADPTYKVLAVSGQLNGRSVLSRILAPPDGEDWGFPQDWWYNSAFAGTHAALNKGYLGYVLSSYQTAPQLYTLSGTTQSGNYCAKFDGSSNVQFYSVGTATTCASLTGSPAYTMPIATTLEGIGSVDSYGVCHSAIFSMPYGGPGGPISDLNEFYLWKAMAIDLARGVALQNATHPVGGWNTAPAAPAPLSDFYLDPMFNKYAYLVHKYMIGNKSYALQYDEPGGLAPTFNSNPSLPLQITVWNIPAYSAPTPTATATPLPCP